MINNTGLTKEELEEFMKQLECLGSNPDWNIDKFPEYKDFKIKNPMKDAKITIINRDGTREELL